MNDLTVFENSQFGQLRCHADENEQTWFCGKDMLSALDYAINNDTSKHMSAVPEEWKGMKPIPTPGGTQEMLCLTEQGLYFFLGRSDKPKALPYQKWVAGEIIPSIRKTGGYKQPAPRRTVDDLNARSTATTLRMMARLKCYPEEMKGVFLAQAAHLTSGLPLAGLLPQVPDDRDRWLSPTAIGEHFGISANAVGRILKPEGLHGQNDPEHSHSQPLSDKSPYSDKQVISYVYDPAVVIPAIEAVLSRPSGAATQ